MALEYWNTNDLRKKMKKFILFNLINENTNE